MTTTLTLFTPAGALAQAAPLKRAAKRLTALGFDVAIDADALARHQRFGGDDATRLAALHRVATERPSIAMATRGGYGMTRLMDQIDWKLLAKSVEHGTRWVGLSDLTALHLGLLAHGKVSSWAGPLACDDFGRTEEDGGVDDVTQDCFTEAMSGALEAVGFRETSGFRTANGWGFDGLGEKGVLWGGNLALVNSLLGTPHWPKVKGGILFLEDINEHPYRVERMLIQLQQAGVLDAQKAVVLGDFGGWTKSPNDRGYNLKSAIAAVQARTKTPILTGLPFGHIRTKVSLPVGVRVELLVQGRDVLIGWEGEHEHHGHDHGHQHHAH